MKHFGRILVILFLLSSTTANAQSRYLELLSRADASYKKASYAEAVDLYSQALSIKQSYDALMWRGISLFESGNYQAAIPDLENALKMNPDDYSRNIIELYLNKATGFSENDMNASSQGRQNRTEGAYVEKANKAYSNGFYGHAASCFEKAYELSGNPVHKYNAGIACYSDGNYHDAIRCMKEFLPEYDSSDKELVSNAKEVIEASEDCISEKKEHRKEVMLGVLGGLAMITAGALQTASGYPSMTGSYPASYSGTYYPAFQPSAYSYNPSASVSTRYSAAENASQMAAMRTRMLLEENNRQFNEFCSIVNSSFMQSPNQYTNVQWTQGQYYDNCYSGASAYMGTTSVMPDEGADNSRWEAYYRQTYADWERHTEQEYNRLIDFKNKNDQGMIEHDKYGSFTTSMLATFRSYQKEMRDTRMEAARKGIMISQSRFETVTINIY